MSELVRIIVTTDTFVKMGVFDTVGKLFFTQHHYYSGPTAKCTVLMLKGPTDCFY